VVNKHFFRAKPSRVVVRLPVYEKLQEI